MPAVEGIGPIQMLCLAFDGNHFKGEILPELDRLKRERIIRIIDLLLVRKDEEGRVAVMTSSDLDWDEATAFGSYVGALAGYGAAGPEGVERGSMAGAAELADGHLFSEGDTFRVTQSLPNNMSAALVLIEHLWAKELRDAVERAGGMELSNEWLRPEEILTAGHDVGATSDVD
ncbi:MAG TPA: hypothetical protein VKA45_02380 [Gaiellaceae bacterium]|nr:hypothetical protein [Gaiellaceae bacterium]